MNLDTIIDILALLAAIFFLLLDRHRRREIAALKYSLSSATLRIRQLQLFLQDQREANTERDSELLRLSRLLREMRASFRRRLGRPEGGININWPYIP